jgi:hypothetical protein
MTNIEIEKAKIDLDEISKIENERGKWDQLVALAQKLNAPIPPRSILSDGINAITRNIHIVLQTEMMLNACISAEDSSKSAKESCTIANRSCKWAAVAAIAALIGAIVSLVSVIVNCISVIMMLCIK